MYENTVRPGLDEADSRTRLSRSSEAAQPYEVG